MLKDDDINVKHQTEATGCSGHVEPVVSGEFMTVADLAELMLDLMVQDKCDHVVTCNGEYWLARKGDTGEIDDKKLTVDLGGYDG